MITEFTVTAGEQPKRLDVFLVNRERDMSRSQLQRLIELGRIRINDQVVRPSQKIKPGDKITMDVPKPEPLELQGEAIPLEVLFEDDHLLVLNKPPGIVVHPAPGNWTGTLVNALLVKALPIYEPDQLVRIQLRGPAGPQSDTTSFTNLQWEFLRDQGQVFTAMAAVGNAPTALFHLLEMIDAGPRSLIRPQMSEFNQQVGGEVIAIPSAFFSSSGFPSDALRVTKNYRIPKGARP